MSTVPPSHQFAVAAVSLARLVGQDVRHDHVLCRELEVASFRSFENRLNTAKQGPELKEGSAEENNDGRATYKKQNGNTTTHKEA